MNQSAYCKVKVKLCYQLDMNFVSPTEISMKVIDGLYPGIKTIELDNLAAQFYQDPTLYWILQQANSLNRDSLYPPIGVQLRIPRNISRILSEFDALNS